MAIFDLGITEEKFWSLTPPQYSALVQRKEFGDKYTDSRFGMIVSTILNVVSGKKGKAIGPLEVMGYDEEDGGKSPVREQTPQETALRMRLLAAASKWGAKK